MVSLIAAVIVFGTIILVHEFGHFLLAKKNGIGVVEFSIGMGPRLFHKTIGETMYSIKILPFGGSCMMVGEDENASEEMAFNNKSVWARISVIAAGPIFNFILAFGIALLLVGMLGYNPSSLNEVMEGTPASEAGLEAGDRITKINNRSVGLSEDILLYMNLHPGKILDVEYTRVNQDGAVQKQETTVVPRYLEELGGYGIGIVFQGGGVKPASMLETVRYSAYTVRFYIRSAIDGIGMLVGGKAQAEDLAGPVRIVSIIGNEVTASQSYGWKAVLVSLAEMCVLLSANLGVMNLLPIPALDGGRLVFLIVEALRGKPIDKEKEGMVHMAGMMLLMALMVFVLFNDIRNLIPMK